MGQLLLTMLISSKHCQVVLDFEEDLFISFIPSLFFIFLFTKKSGGWLFFFLFSSHLVIALGASSIPCSSLYPFFLIDPWQASIILAEMLIHFLYSFGFVYHHACLFFGSHRLLSLLLLLTLLTYTLLSRFINKQKNWHKGSPWRSGGEGRSQGLVFFLFFLVYHDGNLAGWAGYHYHYYGNLLGAWWEIRSWGIFVWIFFFFFGGPTCYLAG